MSENLSDVDAISLALYGLEEKGKPTSEDPSWQSRYRSRSETALAALCENYNKNTLLPVILGLSAAGNLSVRLTEEPTPEAEKGHDPEMLEEAGESGTAIAHAITASIGQALSETPFTLSGRIAVARIIAHNLLLHANEAEQNG